MFFIGSADRIGYKSIKVDTGRSVEWKWGLFPFDGAGGFGGDVVDDAVDAGDLVDDPAGDGFEDVVRDFGPVGGHAVLARHRAEGDAVAGLYSEYQSQRPT